MPERYEAIRDKFLKQGKSSKSAKTSAAKIENYLRNKEGKPPAKFHRVKSVRRKK